MSKGYGVFSHVPDNADDDDLLPYEDDDSGVSWGHALRRRNPWKRGGDEGADYDDDRYAQMTQMTLMRTGVSLPARAAV